MCVKFMDLGKSRPLPQSIRMYSDYEWIRSDVETGESILILRKSFVNDCQEKKEALMSEPYFLFDGVDVFSYNICKCTTNVLMKFTKEAFK